MIRMKIDTVKLRIPIIYYRGLKQYYLDNGYKLRQDDKNQYITKVFSPSIIATLVKIYPNKNRYKTGYFIEFYGLSSYKKALEKEKEMILRLTLDYLAINQILEDTKVTKLDIAIDIPSRPSNISIERKKTAGQPVSVKENIYDDQWFKNHSLYADGSNYMRLRYQNQKEGKILIEPTELKRILKSEIYDIDVAYKKANEEILLTPHKYKRKFKKIYDFWFDEDYFIIKENLIGNYDFNGFSFSHVKSKDRTTSVLYDKAHKESLEYDLSRFEIRIVQRDIKGGIYDNNAISELLNSIYKALDKYKVYVDSKELHFMDFKVENLCLLNSYNYY